ncbi:uracil-DNA glycosylase-like [Anneissia japonica]|uniref:uracil-DNA glycosylase-like n=1 Tax=Anneissia japonica TaxID=1529436 RepID=UPI001425B6B4|nr:uracil-DNA glycosylase-like [Anneissia japonica]
MRNTIYFFKSLSSICSSNMIGQKKISAFFSPSIRGSKRPLSSLENENNQNSPPKVPSSETSTLTAEQISAIEKKKKEAIAKRQKRMSGDSEFMGETWEKALASEFTKPYFLNLKKFVEQERKSQKIFPPADQVYSWTQMCDIREVKVVILGQDPYHNDGQAHGLCFSVPHGIAPPPSLINMYKELQNDIEGFERPAHGNLTGWAKQGVLLLNAVLTVRAHTPNSHKDKGWETFTDAVISWINNNLDDVVFMLWGAYAQKKGKVINKKRHKVLTSVHPSPLSAHRGFFGCKHFSQANKHLEKVNRTPIDWKQL